MVFREQIFFSVRQVQSVMRLINWQHSGPNFCQNYRRMLTALLAPKQPLALCTVYDPHFTDPLMQRLTTTALNIFNDCILREAITHGLPVLDLRLICTEAEDYANEIEPGVPGGKKIAAGILNLVQNHDFSRNRTVSISVFRGGKIRRHVREEQRPTSISPERFQAHQRLISLPRPELARAVKSDLILSAGGLHRAAA